jgi:hypothetical protein
MTHFMLHWADLHGLWLYCSTAAAAAAAAS